MSGQRTTADWVYFFHNYQQGSIMAETFTIKFEKMVAGGDCLGRLPDGRAIFVPFVLPGETVRVNLTDEKKRYARGSSSRSDRKRITGAHHPTLHPLWRVRRLPVPAPGYTKVSSRLKEELLLDQFQRIAHIDNPPIQPIVPSPDSLALSQPHPVSPGQGWRIGLHPRGWRTFADH
jgi:tRNA/tmRNA/rRNA uracil-C5-methylase (TrmA/RlmC/RlmD family)